MVYSTNWHKECFVKRIKIFSFPLCGAVMPKNLSVIKNIFNVDYYNQLNKDVQNKGLDPFKHYIRHGYKEGRKPSNIIQMEYFINNRSLSINDNLELSDISKLLLDIKWSDVFSCHPLVCPLWINLQLGDTETISFVDKLSTKLDVNQISLHPGLNTIPVTDNESLGDIIDRLSEQNIDELSLVDLAKYRLQYDDIRQSNLGDIETLIHFWSEGIYENRLKDFGSSAPEKPSNESIMKSNCLLVLHNKGADRFFPVASKVRKITSDRVIRNFKFDVHDKFILFSPLSDVSSLEWSHVFEIHDAVCCGKQIVYQQKSLSPKSTPPNKSTHIELTDVELLSGASGLPRSTRVCYTVNLNGYDDFPIAPELDDCQYFLITDAVDLPKDDRWIIVRPTLSERDQKRLCLWYKTHPHLLFNWLPFSTWIDSNIQCLSGSEKVFYAHEILSEIATFSHPDRTCVYEEAKVLKRVALDWPEVIDSVVDELKESGMPIDNGLFETNVLFANLNDYMVCEFFNEWWRRVNSGSRRDQMAFSPAAWATGVNISPLDGAGVSSAHNSQYFTLIPHKKKTGRFVI